MKDNNDNCDVYSYEHHYFLSVYINYMTETVEAIPILIYRKKMKSLILSTDGSKWVAHF